MKGTGGRGDLPARCRDRAFFFKELRNMAFIILVNRIVPISLKFLTID
jgi:hypothetical protein